MDAAAPLNPEESLPGDIQTPSATGDGGEEEGGADESKSRKLLRRLSAFKGEGAECSICFTPLPSERVSVLQEKVYKAKRACRHYFHEECIQLLIKSTPAPYNCPLCRQSFETIALLPDVRLDSRGWFHAVDANNTGELTKAEVIDALSATLPVDPELLSNQLNGELWDQWDPAKTGMITLEAFENPSRGLLQFVLYSLPSLRGDSTSAGSSMGAVPDVVTCREGWFRYWDECREQALPFTPMLRSLVRTWRLDGAKEDAKLLRTVLTQVWEEFGLKDQATVTLALFCEKPDGLCEALLAGLQKEWGATKLERIRQRALLLQRPVGELKKEMRKLQLANDCIDKGELVEAILDARANGAGIAATTTPTVSPNKGVPTAATRHGSPGPTVSLAGRTGERLERESSAAPGEGAGSAGSAGAGDAAAGATAGAAAASQSTPSAAPVPSSSGTAASGVTTGVEAGGTPSEATLDPSYTSALHAMAIGELHRRLRALDIPYAHCIERRELEELLAQNGDFGTGPAGRTNQPPTSSFVANHCPENATGGAVADAPASNCRCCIIQ